MIWVLFIGLGLVGYLGWVVYAGCGRFGCVRLGLVDYRLVLIV